MKAKDIIDNYDKIKYYGTGSNEICFLKEYYPICLPWSDSKTSVYLDTGGVMPNCDFFEAKIENGNLYRNSNGYWHRIAPLVEDSLIIKEK